MYFSPQSWTIPTFGFGIYQAGVEFSQAGASTTYSGITSWTVPSSGVVTTNLPAGSFELQQNNTVQIPVTFSFQNKATTGAFIATQSYAVGLDSINWSATGTGVGTTTSRLHGWSDQLENGSGITSLIEV